MLRANVRWGLVLVGVAACAPPAPVHSPVQVIDTSGEEPVAAIEPPPPRAEAVHTSMLAPDAEPPWVALERRAFVLQAAPRGRIVSLAFSRDASAIAVAARSGTIAVLDVATLITRASERLTPPHAEIPVAIDARGERVFVGTSRSGDRSGEAFVWSYRSGDWRSIDLGDHEAIGVVLAVAAAPSGPRFAVVTDRLFAIVDASSGRTLRTRELERPRNRVRWASPSRIVLWNASEIGVDLEIADARDLREVWRDHARSFAIDPEGETIAIATDRTLALHATVDGATRRELSHAIREPVSSTFAAEGDCVAVSDRARTEVMPVAGGTPATIPFPVEWLDARSAIVVAPDGSRRDFRRASAEAGEILVRGAEQPAVFVDPSGALAASVHERIDVIGPHHMRASFVEAGEHGIWNVGARPDGGAIALLGRFGSQVWSGAGVIEAACTAPRAAIDWNGPAPVLVSAAAECDLSTGATRTVLGDQGRDITDDGSHALGAGTLYERARRARTRLIDLPAIACAGGEDADCDPRAILAPRGTAVILAYHEMGADVWLHLWSGANGRALGTLDAHSYAIAPDGAWLAYAHAESAAIVDLATGQERASFEVESSSSAAPARLWPSIDGQRLAWSTGAEVHIVGLDGEEDDVFEASADSIVWARDGRALAAISGQAIVLRDLDARGARAIAVDGARDRFACAGGRLIALLDAEGGGLAERDLGPCDGSLAGISIDPGQRFAIFQAGGIVRVRRIADGAELVLRTQRDPPRVRHFAHDPEGHWWTDDGDGATVPDWVRLGGPRASTTAAPLDPAMRRADLLSAFFGG